MKAAEEARAWVIERGLLDLARAQAVDRRTRDGAAGAAPSSNPDQRIRRESATR